ETITKENDISEDTNITLIKETWETGWGPNHSYHYQYRVKGLSLESDNGKIYTPETLAVGGSVPEASIENGDIIFYWAKEKGVIEMNNDVVKYIRENFHESAIFQDNVQSAYLVSRDATGQQSQPYKV